LTGAGGSAAMSVSVGVLTAVRHAGTAPATAIVRLDSANERGDLLRFGMRRTRRGPTT
jgi:hypothetical protein